MISLGSWSACVLGKQDAVPLAAAPIECGVHRGDSEQDSGGDGCLLSSLTAIASFLIYKCKQTGAKSFSLLSFSLRCTDCLPRSLLATCSLPPKLLLHFLVFLQGLDLSICLPISFVITGFGQRTGWSHPLWGTWRLEIAYSHQKWLSFHPSAVWHPHSGSYFGLVEGLCFNKVSTCESLLWCPQFAHSIQLPGWILWVSIRPQKDTALGTGCVYLLYGMVP